MCSQNDLFKNVHSSSIHYSLKLETTKCSSTREGTKQAVLYLYSRLLIRHKEEWIPYTHNMDEYQKRHVVLQSQMQKKTYCIIPFISWSSRIGLNNLWQYHLQQRLLLGACADWLGGHRGIFWGHANVLYHDRYLGCTAVSIYHNSSNHSPQIYSTICKLYLNWKLRRKN